MSTEVDVATTLNSLQQQLEPDEKEALSKVLFPSEHVTHITLLQKRRELQPLVVKHARKLRSIMQPYAEKLNGAVKSPDRVDIDLDLLQGITDSARLLAEVYGWADVIEKLDAEELTTSEIQTVVVTQLRLQGENDFLLIPLRVAVMVMQAVEIQNSRLRSIFGGRELQRLST